MNRPFRRLTVILLLVSLYLTSLAASGAQRRATGQKREAAPARPKLIVGIVIDQFRYDYLTRYTELFGEDGFKRLMREGAFFENANYIHVPTFTAPGHATFMSGSV